MNARDLDFAAFEGRVDAILAELARRDAQGISFAVASDPLVTSLAELVILARASGNANVGVHFGVDTGGPGEGLLRRLGCEFMAFARGVWRDLTHLAVVDTRGMLHTRIGWAGDATCVVGEGGLTVAGEHCVAVRAHVSASSRRLRLLAIITTAAGKIAGLIATPGAAVLALPVAYKCIRDVYEQSTATGPNAGRPEESWQ